MTSAPRPLPIVSSSVVHALGVPFIAQGLRQVEAWPGVVGLFRHAGGPYPLVLALVMDAANLVTPVLVVNRRHAVTP